MKIRIQDHSIRFRLTLKEVETLISARKLEKITRVLGPEGPAGAFVYALEVDDDARESLIRLEPFAIRCVLNAADLATLADDAQEGVYLRREWRDEAGESQRFMAFVEKDRPGSTCVKPELWIYDAAPDGSVETRPIEPNS